MRALQISPRSLSRAGRLPSAAVLAAAALLLISAWSCKSPTSPDAGEADIIVSSRWTEPLDIFMDGAFKFTLTYKNTAEIDNVSLERHQMEAKTQATGEIVLQEILEISAKTDYTWTIQHRARINCINAFDVPLKIYMDGVFQFNLASGENRWILEVPLGDRFLAAFRIINGQQAQSATIKVTQNKDYTWGIRPL